MKNGTYAIPITTTTSEKQRRTNFECWKTFIDLSFFFVPLNEWIGIGIKSRWMVWCNGSDAMGYKVKC